jgi:DNA-binding transcriptional ArsR family regulator
MNTRTPRRHWSYTEHCILDLLSRHPTGRLSYDSMAAALDIDRRTLVSAMARLRMRGQVKLVEPGRGCQPNQYTLNAA